MEPRLVGGRYAPIRMLASGGYGSVYLASDTQTQRLVALKFLTQGTGDALDRFRREARILTAQRDNDYVVKILDHGLDHAPPYIVMEFCEGGSLRTWVTERRSWREVCAALVHALLGLNGVHEAGGFHRDLKPDNLLLAVHPTDPSHLVVKVGDWGLARAPGTHGPLTGRLGGTEGYIAPEILSGQAFDARADIFSLGAVASELLSADGSGTHLACVAIPEQLRAIVRQMLSPVPAHRPKATAIAQALQRLIHAPDQPQPAVPNTSEGPGIGAFVLGGLLFTGALVALAALAADGGSAPKPPAKL